MSKLILIMAACVVAAGLLFETPAVTQSRGGLSPQEERGKQIYFKGESTEGGEIVAALGGKDGFGNKEIELPATSFACANCHGGTGQGTPEGGIQPSPLTWEVLTRTHTSALTRRERIPYNETTLARSISAGLDSSGGQLHPGMPYYKMTATQMADLIAYLKKLGTETEAIPGVTEQTIKIGAALPMTGPLSTVGEDIKATLNASFAQINSQGGIYGRRFELVVEDSRGDSAQTHQAIQRLIEKGGIFALVGSFENADSSATNELIKRSEIPLLGPVTLSPRLSIPPNPYIFYLLPTFSDQARSLVDFVQTKAGGKAARLAVVYGDSSFDRDALAGLQSQARMYGMEIVAEYPYSVNSFDAAKAVGLLSQKKPDFVFFFGGTDAFNACAREMELAKLDSSLLSSVVMVGRGAFTLPPGLAARTFLSYPSVLPSQNDFAEFITVMQRAGVPLRSPAFQSVAYAGTKVLFEAAKLSGRQLSRETLINSLERIRDFRTGVVPPLTFGPNRRVGSTGSYIVGIDLDKKQYVPLGDRFMPKEKP